MYEIKNIVFVARDTDFRSQLIRTHKIYNEVLIDKLKEFQFESNRLMSDFVDKEKAAIAANTLSKLRSI
jgi:hypothetical protein